MKHGPIALIDDDMPVIFIATKDDVYEKVVSNIQEVKARGGKLIAIVTEGDTEASALADHVIEIPEMCGFVGASIERYPFAAFELSDCRLKKVVM